MALKLAQGENVVREYNYAKTTKMLKTTEESLVITNKRIISRKESTGAGSKGITNYEMPIDKSTCVNVSYGLKSHFSLLILGIVLAIAAIALFVGEVAVAGIFLLVVAAVCIALFIKVKAYSCSCIIYTSGVVTPIFGLGSASFNLFAGKAKAIGGIRLKISVNNEVALAMAEELGAVIEDAKANVVATAPVQEEVAA